MNKFDVFLSFEDKRWQEIAGIDESLVCEVKDAVLNALTGEVCFLSLPKNFMLNLSLSDDHAVHKLNKAFRGYDKPTNVLSFANIDDPEFENILTAGEDVELGDVIMAFETMQKEAAALDIGLKDHFCHLWVHGMLHILGYDHIKEEDRLEMEEKEIKILSDLGIENPYQE